MNYSKFLPVLGVCALVTACGGNSGSSSSSRLSLAITDGPVEMADAVVVVFDSVELQGPERTEITLDEAVAINLLDYQNGESLLLLDGVTLPAGEYQWIRLGVVEAESYIEIDGMQYPLEIPSSAQTGLKMNRGFTLAAGGISQFTIDFDLRKSVHQEGTGDYKLRPTLRLVDNLEVGVISGTVSDALITDVECDNGDNNDMGNVVYLYSGLDATVLDVQGAETDPLASANVEFNTDTGLYEYTLAFVAAGDYTLAFTCDAVLDDPLLDDSAVVTFTAGTNVSVTADEVSTVDF
ncbi:DUF4382 domain-containing protein [Halioxenophilus sp. WMMB6]|uniref:DUF4382 domain-containing protein n=1 Tax=Halioxenophilus sp. WMMB6 TaxID=3073815 RepID=UPI00295ED626|nr:DUF4382 domain-containing protein [Halioxenophilus sp. WMMB6]